MESAEEWEDRGLAGQVASEASEQALAGAASEGVGVVEAGA